MRCRLPSWLLVSIVMAAVVATVGGDSQAVEILRSHLEPASQLAAGVVSSAPVGVRLTRATAVLRQQLGLTHGEGLVVDEVAAGSRAAVAGICQHDVLVRLDDQLLVLPDQFDELMNSASPRTCVVLRGGEEVSLAMAGPAVSRSSPTPLRPTPSSLAIVKQAAPAVRTVPTEAKPDGGRGWADETLVRQDPDFLIRLTSGTELRLVVFESSGRVVFNDTIDTPTARGGIPPAVQDRVTEMERMLERRRPDRHADAAVLRR